MSIQSLGLNIQWVHVTHATSVLVLQLIIHPGNKGIELLEKRPVIVAIRVEDLALGIKNIRVVTPNIALEGDAQRRGKDGKWVLSRASVTPVGVQGCVEESLMSWVGARQILFTMLHLAL